MRIALLLSLILILAACTGSPTEPAPEGRKSTATLPQPALSKSTKESNQALAQTSEPAVVERVVTATLEPVEIPPTPAAFTVASPMTSGEPVITGSTARL